MADIVSKEKRSQMMAGIKGKNTKPELTIRSGLHRIGFRFLLHKKDLPGKPDLVFPKYNAVLFVHGCFFHGHGCHIFKWPKSNTDFWHEKITGNTERDKVAIDRLHNAGWRTGVVWECALKGCMKLQEENVINEIANWLRGTQQTLEIIGRHE